MAAQSLLKRLRTLLVWLGFGGALTALVAALLVVGLLGRDVLLIAPFDPSTVELNRALHAPGDSVAELYGNPLGTPVRVIAPNRARIVRPAEDPSLVLLKVDKQRGENPLQARTIWFFSKFAIPALVLVGVIGVILPRQRMQPVAA
jgi:hypothetical protein